MSKRYLPTILASDGREYTNVSWKNCEKAEKELQEFCEIFSMYHDEEIKKAYVVVYEI